MDDDFYRLARQCNKDRLAEEESKRYDLDYVSKTQYSLFKCWCNGCRAKIVPGTNGIIDFDRMEEEVYHDLKVFKECFDEIDGKFGTRIPDFLLKKKILSKFFDCELIINENGECFAKKKTL